MFIILTATVTPQVDEHIHLIDPERRREQYRSAIAKWVELSEDMDLQPFIVENSGEDLPRLVRSAVGHRAHRMRHLAVSPPLPSVVSMGKGAAEAQMLNAAIQSLGSGNELEMVFKCTGRLFVRNFDRCVSQAPVQQRTLIADIPRKNFSWIDSRFFGASLGVWKSELRDVGVSSNDREGINYEHELATSVNNSAASDNVAVQNFREKPWVVGQSGTTGHLYGTSFVETSRRTMTRPLDRLRRHFQAEFKGY
ncbi:MULTISPECIES: hypothetical protein [Cryobacterium]|uniref:hypothetical protein n=1 Tax=Cryobacterium TaxID=69578 RepID=UPI0010574C34|nr:MULTISPECIES: hypothetical protein [Cryobacterium]TFC41086.1 hypothetical protein E3O57_17630 [Cryobacterium sp. TMN-39-2]